MQDSSLVSFAHRISYSHLWHLLTALSVHLSTWAAHTASSDGPIHFLSGKSSHSHAQIWDPHYLTIVERGPNDTPSHFLGESALVEFWLPHYIFVDMGSHLGSPYSGNYSTREVLKLLWWDSPQKINFSTLKAPFNKNNAKPICSQI